MKAASRYVLAESYHDYRCSQGAPIITGFVQNTRGYTNRIVEAMMQCMSAATALGTTFVFDTISTCDMPAGCYLDTHGSNAGKLAYNLDMTESCPKRTEAVTPN